MIAVHVCQIVSSRAAFTEFLASNQDSKAEFVLHALGGGVWRHEGANAVSERQIGRVRSRPNRVCCS